MAVYPICRAPSKSLDRRRRRRLGRLAAIVVALPLLAACDDGASHEPKRADPITVTGSQCLAMLDDRDIVYERIDPVDGGNGCAIATAIELRRSTVAFSRPATLGCQLALRFSDFERRVLQPMARRYFGQRVARIHHYGGYACRGRSGDASRLSEHAAGRAIDVAAFELADGTVIRVEHDWKGHGRRARFLWNVARDACDVFHVVLGPNHDGAHQDHLHFDIGPWRLCEA